MTTKRDKKKKLKMLIMFMLLQRQRLRLEERMEEIEEDERQEEEERNAPVIHPVSEKFVEVTTDLKPSDKKILEDVGYLVKYEPVDVKTLPTMNKGTTKDLFRLSACVKQDEIFENITHLGMQLRRAGPKTQAIINEHLQHLAPLMKTKLESGELSDMREAYVADWFLRRLVKNSMKGMTKETYTSIFKDYDSSIGEDTDLTYTYSGNPMGDIFRKNKG